LSSCAWLPAAAAQTEVPSARLELDASPDCTTRAELIARVQARSPRVKFDEAGTTSVRAQFSVAPSGTVTGAVVLATNRSPRSVRQVVAGSCGEAADAVALIIAITLDPTGVIGGSRVEPAPSKPPEEAMSRPAELQPSNAKPEPPAQRGRQTFGFQLGAQALVGPAPGAMPGVAVFATIGVDRPALWSPAVLLGAGRAWQTDISAQGGKAAFELDAASFDACPFRFRLGKVEARPCASALIGRLTAQGSETLNQAPEHPRPFWVVGGAANATLELVWLLELSARLAVGANLVRDSFEFTPLVFHQVPAVTVAGSMGIGLRWR